MGQLLQMSGFPPSGRRMDESEEEQGYRSFWRSGSLCSMHSWSVFVELGTESSSHLLVRFQGFSWAIVAKIFESERSLARGFAKKMRQEVEVVLDCSELPAP